MNTLERNKILFKMSAASISTWWRFEPKVVSCVLRDAADAEIQQPGEPQPKL